MDIRTLAVSAPLALALATFAAPASASVVVARGDGAVHVEEERLAMSSTPERTVVWEQLSLDVARGDVAWIVAVPKGGWIEAADDGWLDALDGGSAPVIAPAKSLACGGSGATPYEDTAAPFAGVAPRAIDQAIVDPTAPLLALDALRAKGWTIDARTAAMLADLDAAGEQVEALQLSAGTIGPTKTIRVVGPAGRAFPTTLLPVLAPSPRIVAFVLDDTRVLLAGAPAVAPKFDSLVWEGGSLSNYENMLADALSGAGSGVVVPFASPDALFADQPMGPLQNGASVMRRYFHADDASSTGPWVCAHRAIDAMVHGGVVAPTCAVPPPWKSDAPVPGCSGASTSAVPASTFMCGDADDLAVALGGAAPGATWITRWQATPAIETSTPLPLDDAHAGAIPAFHEAQSAKEGACAGGSTSPTPSPSTGPSSNGGDSLGSGDPSSSGSSSNDYASRRGGCDATFGCASHSSSSGSGGCDSSSDSSGGGCSSSSDGSSGGGCGSSSGSSSDDGCGKGSGGGSSDSGCGGSSGGSSGGGCGGGGGGSDNGCSISPRKTHIRATPFAYLAVALAVFARRATRRRHS